MTISFMRLPIVATMSALVLAGCATVIGSPEQSVTVRTQCKQQVFQRRCLASNDKGSWSFVTPATLSIPRSSEPLALQCESGLFDGSLEPVSAQPSIETLGNIVLGGLLGLAVDVNNDRAFAYPSEINIELPLCKFL